VSEIHEGKIKIAPAAANMLRSYLISPSEIVPTGPKNHLTKTDVLAFIEKNNLKLGDRVNAPASSADPGSDTQ